MLMEMGRQSIKDEALLFLSKLEARDLTHTSAINGVLFHRRGGCPGAIPALTSGTTHGHQFLPASWDKSKQPAALHTGAKGQLLDLHFQENWIPLSPWSWKMLARALHMAVIEHFQGTFCHPQWYSLFLIPNMASQNTLIHFACEMCWAVQLPTASCPLTFNPVLWHQPIP